jgi:Arc/MetJ-type ribon-helix-helix transcriptional regulator
MSKQTNENMKVISIYIPKIYLNTIRSLKKLKIFTSISDAIRNFIREGLQKRMDNVNNLTKFLNSVEAQKELLDKLEKIDNMLKDRKRLPEIITAYELVSEEIVGKTRVREYERYEINLIENQRS